MPSSPNRLQDEEGGDDLAGSTYVRSVAGWQQSLEFFEPVEDEIDLGRGLDMIDLSHPALADLATRRKCNSIWPDPLTLFRSIYLQCFSCDAQFCTILMRSGCRARNSSRRCSASRCFKNTNLPSARISQFRTGLLKT